MNKLNIKFQIYKNGIPDYNELYDFFSSHRYTYFSKSDFKGYISSLFEKNPFGKGLQGIARNKNNDIVGYISVFSVPFNFGNVNITGGQLANVLIHSDFRKKGLFNKIFSELLISIKKHKYDISYVFPNPNSLEIVKKSRFELKELSYWKKEITENIEFGIKNSYMPIKSFDNACLGNIMENKENKLLQISKSSEYLNWRFITLGKYFKYEIFKILDDSEECLGIVVFKEYEENKKKYGQIIYTNISSNIELLNDLLNFYHNHYIKKKILNLQFFFLAPIKIKRYLLSKDFRTDSKGRFIAYNSNNPKIINTIKSDNVLLYLSSKDNL